ncbi:hypothetical protein [Aquimarina sp. RZ0]|uniref:hypothetical protein n=1 Tax=Aquimarina sp. RZ0 TaxID=2607730 RepID=UPI0011F29686|nr:hypothetical protein [Aquimarina sp. RZ0]KAA1242519.1 hypothetical protein F0000_25290 [Aquimarina sp. RZ0]
MVIEIESDLFFNEEFFDEIDQLFDFFIKNRYNYYIDDEIIFKSQWLLGARKSKNEFLQKSFANSAYITTDDKLTISSKNEEKENRLTLKDGLIYLSNPILVFIENSYYDSKCYKGIFSKFESAEKLLFFNTNRWLEYRNCGGKDGVKNQINLELKRYRKETLDNHKYLRAIIILDSDKRFPSDDDNYYEDFINYFELKGIKIHILEKREIENYLPLIIFERETNVSDDAITALKELDENQLDYYDYEKGFKINSRKKLLPLFENISDKNYEILKSGFDNKDFRTKREIPKLFLSNSITKEMLLDRCRHQNDPKELENIIEKINGLL